jgi:serpin B
VFISPYSVGTALANTLAGAKGETARQLKKAIGYRPDDDPAKLHHEILSLTTALNQVQGVELSVANALWVSNAFPLHPEFVKRVQELLSEAINLDFKEGEEARHTINTWVEEKTKQKIKDLLPSCSIDARIPLIITNAIYFNGTWAHPFKKESTRDQDFHLLNNSAKVTAKMMQQSKLKIGYGSFDDYAMMELPYEGPGIVMLLALPHENSANALQSLCSEDSLKKMIADSRSLSKAEVNVKLPQFKFSFEVELSDALQEIGISEPFSDSADFSLMVSPDAVSQQLRIGKVYHKGFVEVNEEGTEAAAATAAFASSGVVRTTQEVDFVVDRPFVFVIYNAFLRVPLFVGKVVDPTA